MLDTKEEQRFDQLRKLTRELHLPLLETFLTLEVFDKDGKLLHSDHQRSHSWTRNAYNALFSVMGNVNLNDDTFGAGKLSGKDTGGVVIYGAGDVEIDTDGTFESTLLGLRAGAGNDAWGIMVGSGTDAESFEDYVLQTKLTEGTGAGQITYQPSEAIDKSYAGLTWTHTLIRYFNNNSAPAGDRDVNEVALGGKYKGFGAANKIVLMVRDHLASTVTVPSTGQLKVTYTIQLTYPA